MRLWNRNSPNCQPTASLHFVPLSTIKWIDGLSLDVGLTVYSVCLWFFLFVCLFVLIFNAFTIVYPHSWEEHPDIKIDDSFSGERMYRCDVQMHMHKKTTPVRQYVSYLYGVCQIRHSLSDKNLPAALMCINNTMHMWWIIIRSEGFT